MLQIDRKLKQLVGPDAAVQLTPTEWAIVDRLYRSQGEIISPDELTLAAWPNGASPSFDDLKSLRDHIYNIRAKITLSGCDRDMLQTIVGWGYVLFLSERRTNVELVPNS
jgi:DNA-binding response OmpR family regulator